jgi:hypothetical protein
MTRWVLAAGVALLIAGWALTDQYKACMYEGALDQ